MRDRENNLLDRLVEAVRASPKYRNVCADFIANLGAREIAKGRSLKEATKATKNKLHQVGGAYLDHEMDYAGWRHELEGASRSAHQDDFPRVCAEIMSHHVSTRERLRLVDRFYATTLAGLPPIRTVLDIACGFNPLAIPWMPLAADAEYYAYEVYRDMVDFLNAFLTAARVRGCAEALDATQLGSTPRADLAFLLKAIPCLEQIDKSIGGRLLEGIDADHLLVSFPVRSLGGREKAMTVNYEDRFRQLVERKAWGIKRFEFESELAFLVTKEPSASR